MKNILLTLGLILIVTLTGCSNNGQKVKDALKSKYPACQKDVDSINPNTNLSQEAILFMSLYISQCNNTQEILEAIKEK
jgi:ABC-type oligopeptide transport system substrate-binding subunit